MARTWPTLTSQALGVGDVTDAHSFLHGQTYEVSQNVLAHDRNANDGSTDATQAFLDAKAELGADGGKITAPPGIYKVDLDALDFSGSRSVTIEGSGGLTGGAAPGTIIRASGAGSGSIINAQNSSGFKLKDVMLQYESASFTGRLVDLRNLGGADTAYAVIENCSICSNGPQTAIGVALDNAICCTIRNNYFSSLSKGIVGRTGSAEYSNGMTVMANTFGSAGPNGNIPNGHIVNPGGGWLCAGNIHEAADDSAAKAFVCENGGTANGLMIVGSWFGDTSSGTVIGIGGNGLNVLGNYIGALGGTGVSIGTASFGVVIKGNEITDATIGIDFPGAGYTGVDIEPNTYTTCTANVSGYVASYAFRDPQTMPIWPDNRVDGSAVLQWGAGGRTKHLAADTTESPWDAMNITSFGFSGSWQGAINFKLSYNQGSLFKAATLRANTDGTTAALDVTGTARATAGLGTNHVAAATPTGGSSGDIKIGNGKIWVNDAGTWKSVAIA